MRKLGVLLLLLAVAGCGGEPVRTVTEASRLRGPARGIDLPIDSRDVSQELKSSAVDFVARYYRHATSRWPTLSPEEARTVSAIGKNLVTVFESHSHKADYFSYDAGYRDGIAAYTQAKRVGQPPGSAIYFAVDYNAPAGDIAGPVDRYFRGVHAGLTAAAGRTAEYRVGVYGSGAVCGYMKRTRLAQYAWLSGSTAWSGYNSFSDWDIKQSRRSAVLSFDHTFNEARGDYGAFNVATRYTSL